MCSVFPRISRKYHTKSDPGDFAVFLLLFNVPMSNSWSKNKRVIDIGSLLWIGHEIIFFFFLNITTTIAAIYSKITNNTSARRKRTGRNVNIGFVEAFVKRQVICEYFQYHILSQNHHSFHWHTQHTPFFPLLFYFPTQNRINIMVSLCLAIDQFSNIKYHLDVVGPIFNISFKIASIVLIA